jgi:hypothetical protein
MIKFLFSTMAVAVVLAAVVNAAITVHAIQPSADEKADSQADKGHIGQADYLCQKGGYDGYIAGNCGNVP